MSDTQKRLEDLDDMLLLELTSVTIFWDDLLVPTYYNRTEYASELLAKFWDDEVEPWLKLHIKCDYNAHEAGIWFADRRDAILFKLAWGGQFPVKSK